MTYADAQALYDHTGTMPYAPGSWSNNVREELSEILFSDPRNGYTADEMNSMVRGSDPDVPNGN